jgi:hypothetical protein
VTVLIDALIATGGTMLAGTRPLEMLGATVREVAAIVDCAGWVRRSGRAMWGCRCSRWWTWRGTESLRVFRSCPLSL